MEFKLDNLHSKELDSQDPLKNFRDKFLFPSPQSIYLCGHSLGLQPKTAKKFVDTELDSWATLAVEGHKKGKNPWFDYHSFLTDGMSAIVGSDNTETVVMNSLTTNLHMLMISFFRPNSKKYKIMIDVPVFPSDKYAAQSQLKLHGLDPKKDLVEINTYKNNSCISNDKMADLVEANLENVALILLSGVNYYTGQLYDIDSIAKLANKHNVIIGLDLAHAAGNVVLDLTKSNIDFASWCGYKYLNGGPGAPSGAFVHKKHHSKSDLIRLEGWWGHDKQTRFNPPLEFSPIKTVESWQLSNPPILSMAALRSSLQLFDEVGMEILREKSVKLTDYLEYLILSLENKNISIITPSNSLSRGAQLSLCIKTEKQNLVDYFASNNIVCDFRKPDVVRVAPNAFYNSFSDIYNFVEVLKSL